MHDVCPQPLTQLIVDQVSDAPRQVAEEEGTQALGELGIVLEHQNRRVEEVAHGVTQVRVNLLVVSLDALAELLLKALFLLTQLCLVLEQTVRAKASLGFGRRFVSWKVYL